MKKYRSAFDILFLASLGAIITCLGVAILILPQKDFSQKENRALKKMPALSLSCVWSGEYFKELGDFYQDQFPLRNNFTALYALAEKGVGKIEVNGVITTADGVCVALPKNTGVERARKNLSAISSLAKNKKVHLYVPPSSFDVFYEQLPSFYPQSSVALSVLNGEALDDFLEMTDIANEEYYYKTDHHWTTKGAYFAYTQICERMNVEPYAENHFVKTEMYGDFRGTSAAKSGLPNWLITADTVTLYRYSNDDDITVENHETGERTNGFYSYDAVEGDKYKVFLGGNYSHISIYGKESRPTLLLIKDSFANSVIPFLSLHFDIEVIDPRYCTKEQLRAQIEREDVDLTLILMSFDTLTTNIFN